MVSCKKCYKYYNKNVLSNCSICNRIFFSEAILCELLQLSHDNNLNEIECFSYRPNLSIIDSKKKKKPEETTQEIADNEITLSNKNKWLKAYALQQWEKSPDKILCNLSFHVCIITKNRETVFLNTTDLDIASMFSQASSLFTDTVIELLTISADHIHVYINASPDYSIDEIINNTIDFIENKIFITHNDSTKDTYFFERSYFAESIS